MAYVSIPKDLNEVKSKMMFNLTKRQLICFSLGLCIGLPIFFTLKKYTDTSVATFIMMFSMLPFFLLAMYEKHNQPLEVILKQIYLVKFGTQKARPYKTKNFYDILEKQYDLKKEVMQVVRGKPNSKKEINQSRKKRN